MALSDADVGVTVPLDVVVSAVSVADVVTVSVLRRQGRVELVRLAVWSVDETVVEAVGSMGTTEE